MKLGESVEEAAKGHMYISNRFSHTRGYNNIL
jgi:hypothetical protein